MTESYTTSWFGLNAIDTSGKIYVSDSSPTSTTLSVPTWTIQLPETVSVPIRGYSGLEFLGLEEDAVYLEDGYEE